MTAMICLILSVFADERQNSEDMRLIFNQQNFSFNAILAATIGRFVAS
jgi:hypothetical protein